MELRGLEIVYETEKVEKLCTSLKAAKRFFGGDERIARSLLARINSLAEAPTIRDIVVQKPLHFHNLTSKGKRDLRGYFAIDIAGRKSPWRLVIQPLDENKEPFDPCNIDEISDIVEVVGILEVSNHYE